MEDRTLDPNEEDVTEEIGHSETTESEESEETSEEDSADKSLDELLDSLPEKARKEVETLKKKSQDFDGLVAKRRKIETTPKAKVPGVSVTEDAIRSVLYKDNERKVLRETINPKSAMFIPELVDDAQFRQIVSYLPRSLDRSSSEAIHRGLMLATRMWKEDKGMKEDKKKPEAELLTERGSGSGSEQVETKKTGRKLIKKAPSFDTWYKK